MITRLYIEQSILGAIVYYNGYAQIAHILSPKNFTSKSEGFIRNAELFSVICSLYPHKPIDFITIGLEVQKRYPGNPEIMQTLCTVGHKVCSTSSIVQWAFILLQIDISEKFKAQMVSYRSQREINLDHTEAGGLKEIIEAIDSENDIFEVIEGANKYFKHLNMDEELDNSIKLYQDLSRKISSLKSINSVQVALAYVFQICEASTAIQFESSAFASAIADMVCTNQVKPKYTEAADILRTVTNGL
ncbi:MAG TPA: hypothetical protein VF679_01615 [Pedobacter sp.]|jgi:hypothetical protein